MPRTAAERFWPKVERRGPDECWEWCGAIVRGYGRFTPIIGGNGTTAHRTAYELAVGPIPDGLHIDHLCRNTRCVNPAHLEAVTPGENTRRAPTASTINAAKTHCPEGHPYDEVNTYRDRHGKRSCRACQRERRRTELHPRKPKTTCPRGHPLTPDNLVPSQAALGKRVCLICNRAWHRAYRRKRAAA